LLLPAGITDRLTPPQLKAIVAHELCHVRRRDNLATALHMGVEALFWFHPLVWWLGARLMEERERACDEEVLLMGSVTSRVVFRGFAGLVHRSGFTLASDRDRC
jgi:bla regulator protein BlaR1